MGAKAGGGASGATSLLTRSGKEARMNRVSKLSHAVAVVAAFTAVPTTTTQPGQTVNPNGFPGGEHNNLNIHGNND